MIDPARKEELARLLRESVPAASAAAQVTIHNIIIGMSRRDVTEMIRDLIRQGEGKCPSS